MTIALGILTKDAVVVGADTEQGWSYLKTSGTKVLAADGRGAIAVTGSGTSGYLQSLSQELKSVFLANSTLTAKELEVPFKDCLATFFQLHIFPAVALSPPPYCDVVIGIERNGERRLWASTNEVLRECDQYGVVGFGAEYAEGTLKKFLDPNVIDLNKVDVVIAQRLAAYAIFIAKESVKHCGMGTDIVSLEGGKATPIDAGVLQILEYHFNSFLNLQFLGLQYAVGYPFKNDKKALEALTRYFKSLQSSVGRLRGITTSSKPWSLE
jgi:20S proteasome alpha/beta subunit